MEDVRQHIVNSVRQTRPFNDTERAQKAEILTWLDSGIQIFRTAKPATPPQHLVSYFLLFDEATRHVTLVDHAKAKAWLPPDGHVAVDEDPRETVTREAQEELGVHANIGTEFGDQPFFITSMQTKGCGFHTDVQLWYVLRGEQSWLLTYDRREFNSCRWWSPDDILARDISEFDPGMHRFIRKLQAYLVQ